MNICEYSRIFDEAEMFDKIVVDLLSKSIFTTQPLRAVGVLFSPMVSG